jgi:phosphate transport system substrate-binding protein
LQSTALAEEVLKIGGCGTALGSMQLLARAFERSTPNIKVIVIVPGLGSSAGIKAVSKAAIDIGLSARPITNEERKLSLSVIEYATTPFVLATRKDVNVSDLSTDEIVKIYRGEKETWLGGKRIRLVLRPPTDMDTVLTKAISPEMSKAIDAALSRRGMIIAMTDQDCVDIIEKTPGGLGFTTLTQIVSEKCPLKILSLNGLTPSLKTLADGSYPLSKTLYFVMKTEPSVLVRKVMGFVRSSEGRKILEESGNLVVMGRSGG